MNFAYKSAYLADPTKKPKCSFVEQNAHTTKTFSARLKASSCIQALQFKYIKDGTFDMQ